jgi:hypothetical protein
VEINGEVRSFYSERAGVIGELEFMPTKITLSQLDKSDKKAHKIT